MNILIQPPVIAHRGASAYAPENTLVAFRKAKQLGIHWVEFDVMLTADSEIVVIHDETLDRTTNGSGLVAEATLSALKSLDAGGWFQPQFSNERIPTFQEVINCLRELQLSANVEIKAQPGGESQAAKMVLHHIQSHWPTELAPPLISSFSREILQCVRAYSKTCILGFLMDEWLDDWQTVCDELQAATVNVNHDILTAERVRQIKASGRTLLSYTVDDPQLATTLYDWGVDAVFSNVPDKIANIATY